MTFRTSEPDIISISTIRDLMEFFLLGTKYSRRTNLMIGSKGSQYNRNRSKSNSNGSYEFLKVRIFWECHKYSAHLPLFIYKIISRRWVKCLWPSQNIRTLKESGFRRIWKSDKIGTVNHKKCKFSLFSEIFCKTAMVK